MPHTKPIKDPKDAIARGFSQPLSLFRRWQRDAARASANSANTFLLATLCSKTLHPSQRPMQLADLCDNSFLFVSTLGSRKGEQIAGNQNVNLLFDWLLLTGRYVSVEGEATLVCDRHVVNSYFQKTFSADLKCYFRAIDSNQSKVIDSEFKEKFQDIKHKLYQCRDTKISPPDSMVLFKVEPSYCEFYENSTEVGNVRLAYSRLTEGAVVDNRFTFCANPDWIVEQIAQ